MSTVVFDNGSNDLRAGFGQSDEPQISLRSAVGRPKHRKVVLSRGLNNAVELDENKDYCGELLKLHRGIMQYRYPIASLCKIDPSTSHPDSYSEHADNLQFLWTNVFQTLSVEPSDCPILLSGFPNIHLSSNRTRNISQTAEIFFETFSSPSLYFGNSETLSLMASGRQTGLVIDSGEESTRIVPIYSGFELKHSIRRMEVAGSQISTVLGTVLRENGKLFNSSAELEVLRDIKEKLCSVRVDESQLNGVLTYKLPDGSEVSDTKGNFDSAPEVLFQPKKFGFDYDSIVTLSLKSIFSADLTLRKHFCRNIILTGGSTLHQGFSQRYERELSAQLPKFSVEEENISDIDVRITSASNILSSQPPTNLSWTGGSLLAGLSSFKDLLISRDAYLEQGFSCMPSF